MLTEPPVRSNPLYFLYTQIQGANDARNTSHQPKSKTARHYQTEDRTYPFKNFITGMRMMGFDLPMCEVVNML